MPDRKKPLVSGGHALTQRLAVLICCLFLLAPGIVSADTGSISGRVTDGTKGIPGVVVYVYDSVSNNVIGVLTNLNGYYVADAIPSGTYKVRFLGVFAGYVSQWYRNRADYTSGDPVTVSAPGETRDIDAVLSPGGTIVGRVTDGADPIPNISVSVYTSNCVLSETVFTNFNGEYAVGGLPSGNYRVLFSGGSSGFISEWYSDKPSCSVAQDVAVTAPETVQNVNAALLRTGGIVGRVTDGTRGIRGVTVAVYDGACTGLVTTAATNLNGDYAVGGLSPGAYHVFFSGASSGFTSEWYSDKASCALADSVTVNAADATLDVDGALVSLYRSLAVSKAGSGSGTVLSTPSAIQCGTVCTTSFITGTPVSLSAAADTGSFFGGWTGPCTGNASPCAIVVSGDTSVGATFDTYAGFAGAPTTGGAPLLVGFTDQSLNSPISWLWSFGDGASSILQNPSHWYLSPGTYSVSLSSTGPSITSQLTRTDYITVAPCTNGFVRVEGRQDYSFIQDAYTAALPDDVIKVQALGFTENLLFNADKRVTITGGYDCPYAVTGGPLTIVHGSLTVGGPASGSGGVTIGNLTIR